MLTVRLWKWHSRTESAVRSTVGTETVGAECASCVQSKCRLCGHLVRHPLRIRHIYREHLMKPIYKCTMCPYGSTYHRTNVVAHMRSRHAVSAKEANPHCVKQEYQMEVDGLLYSCFGDTRIARCQSPSVVECVRDIVESVCTGEEGTRRGLSGEQERSREGIDFVNDLTKSRKRKAVDCSLLYSSECALCHLSGIVHRERHVLQHHLNRAVFTCPHCDFSSSYAKSSVKDHVRTQHPLATPSEPVDRRLSFKNHIDYFYMKCFASLWEDRLPKSSSVN